MTNHRPACRARLAGKLVLQIILFAAISASSRAQATPAPTFEVATVKLSDTKNPSPPSVSITPDRFEATGMTLKELIKIAYDMNYGAEQQISGGPAWVASERFDLDAKEDEALSAELEKLPEDQQGVHIREMLRALLAERFRLQLHHESKELPVYELVPAKGGSKLMPAVAHALAKEGDTSTKPRSWIRFAGRGLLEANEADSPMLATVLSMQPEIGGRLVVDKTGLTGKYDFTLRWTPDLTQGADSSAEVGPSLFTALQEELGLRLESAKAPVDMIVIDHVDLPSAN
jgi:uncharacterized protein (TIGR03435 family)